MGCYGCLSVPCGCGCFGCSVFSQHADAKFYDIKEFEKEVKHLAKLTDGLIGHFELQGGEPLLHPQINEFLVILRKYFPESGIWIITNGILLPKQKDDFWETCRDNKVEIHPTKYPIKIDWQKVSQKCQTYGIPLIFYGGSEIQKVSWKFNLEPKGNLNPFNSFVGCLMANVCTSVKEGKLYACGIPANIHIFNKKFNQNLKVSKLDYLDLYKVKDYAEILHFVAKPLPFCRYCDVAKWYQGREWQASKKDISEYYDV